MNSNALTFLFDLEFCLLINIVRVCETPTVHEKGLEKVSNKVNFELANDCRRRNQTADSTVHVLSLSLSRKSCPVPVCCPDFLSGVFLFGFCPPSEFCPDFCKEDCPMSFCSDFDSLDSVRHFRKNAVRCLDRTRQSCSDFQCPCPTTSG